MEDYEKDNHNLIAYIPDHYNNRGIPLYSVYCNKCFGGQYVLANSKEEALLITDVRRIKCL